MLHASLIPRAPLRGAVAALICAGSLTVACPAAAQQPCFERLDNGIDMTGWQRSTTNHHGPGLGWTVEDGTLVGRQTTGQLGGILMTNKMYRDVEVVFEVKIDWGCDSGFFFRTTGGDRAYQVTIDHLTGGTVGGIYGESFATLVQALDFTLTDLGSTAVVTPGRTPMFDLAAWATIWHPTDFNEIRARIEGNPPHIQVWISNLKVMDFTDDQVRNEIALAGPLSIQVHGGDRFIAGGAVRFRNVRAKDLTIFCMDELDAGGASPDASPDTSQPEAATERDARSIGDAAGDLVGGAVPDVGSGKNPSPGSDAETAPDSAAGRGESGTGCACGMPRSRADTRVAMLLLLASVGAMRHRQIRGRPRR
jgi:3-keto-disaccharide hydrolase